MPTDFTGTPNWEDTITGPANVDNATGESVCDMGVLLANRTLWLAQSQQEAVSANETQPTHVYSAGAAEEVTGGAVTVVLAQDATVVLSFAMPVVETANGTTEITLRANDGTTDFDATTTEVVHDSVVMPVLGFARDLDAGTYTFYPVLHNPDGDVEIKQGLNIVTGFVIKRV